MHLEPYGYRHNGHPILEYFGLLGIKKTNPKSLSPENGLEKLRVRLVVLRCSTISNQSKNPQHIYDIYIYIYIYTCVCIQYIHTVDIYIYICVHIWLYTYTHAYLTAFITMRVHRVYIVYKYIHFVYSHVYLYIRLCSRS